MSKVSIRGLYYITHINNIPSILNLGILSHTRIMQDQVSFTPIYDKQIVAHRQKRIAPDGRSLWDFANLYFQPRNPMMYRVKIETNEDIAVLLVRPDILNRQDAFVSVGNAASLASEIVPAQQGLKAIHAIWNILENDWWREDDGSKRKIMSEFLVPERIEPKYIQSIYVSNHTTAQKVRELVPELTIPVIPEPHKFFRPLRTIPITGTLALVEGDMFFSQMHTLTISVNCVGIMGKGLASRAKYQFPDVYVHYQELCQKKKLKMGSPAVYKRESPLDYQLLDEPLSLEGMNTETWFLLFPTKHHWRERSDKKGIEDGLRWLQDHYKQEGIKSLATPALGCGLGGLEWQDIGPLMCRYLSALAIPVLLYLPREKEIAAEHLTKEFLLET